MGFFSCCAVTGQGAGVAAAISLKSGQDFANLNLAPVQAELQQQGVRIH
jgi:hypothetical protein